MKAPLVARAVDGGFESIELLRRIAPPDGVIHLGAGKGAGRLHRWRKWEIPYALVVDADDLRLDWIASCLEQNAGWCAASVVISDVDGSAPFYKASNPEESGLLASDSFRSLWPNLRTLSCDDRETVTTDTLLSRAECPVLNEATTIWIIVDCLPAARILRGAEQAVGRASVIWVRILLDALPGGDVDALLTTTADILLPRGFHCVGIEESNHPAVGYAAFVRDWRSVLEPQLDATARQNTSLAQDLDVTEQLLQVQKARAEENEALLLSVRGLESKHRDVIAKLVSEKQTVAGQLAIQQRALEEALGDLLEQKHRLEQVEAELLAVRADESKQREMVSGLLSEKEALVAQFASQSKVLEETGLELAAQQKRAREADAALLAVRAAESKQREMVSGLLSEKEALAAHFARQSTVLEETRLELAAQQTRAQEGEMALVAVRAEETRQCEIIADLLSKSEAMAVQLESQRKTIEEAKQDLMAAQERVNDSATALAEARTEESILRTMTADLEVQKEMLAQQLREQLQVLDAAKGKVASMERLIEDDRQKLGSVTRDLDARTKALAESCADAARLKEAMAQKDNRILELESVLGEMHRRQQQIHIEMIKAEGQIDLIKDIVLRESDM